MVCIDTLRALVVATNSLRYNPEIDPDAAAAYERILFNLRDKLCQERVEAPNQLLTLNDLLAMDGEPVWVEFPKCPEASGWMIVDVNRNCVYNDLLGNCDFENCGKNWIAYSRKPEEGV